GNPVIPAELVAIRALSIADMQRLNSETMRRVQAHNDAHGVPVPEWRLARGLFDPEEIREGQRAAAARQAERRAAARELATQQTEPRPRRRRTEVYPGERV